MATYLMFGKYSQEALDQISAERSEKAIALLKDLGAETKAGYALMGEHDLVLVVEFPDNESALKASVGLSRLLGIAFKTAPAVSIEAFDHLIETI
jgi:uncharacterized protein with GYD domain